MSRPPKRPRTEASGQLKLTCLFGSSSRTAGDTQACDEDRIIPLENDNRDAPIDVVIDQAEGGVGIGNAEHSDTGRSNRSS